MEVINENELHQFCKRHSGARKPLGNWLTIVKQATWHSFPEVKGTLGAADYVKDMVIFNIGGNNFRLIAAIDYTGQKVYVLNVMTHAEYNKWEA